ncbi:MAG: glycoside hydrolase family 35 protein [Candidatus Ornithomonoglobus sp.]
MSGKLIIQGDKLFMNGSEFYIRAGAVHYFRIHPSDWERRLIKLKECGLNTVETYIAWNIQEPERGKFISEGTADFERFIEIAETLGLYVIIRPGPYICAEWEMGGFPPWLMNIEGIELRRDNAPYLECVRRYLSWVMDICRPHFLSNGGGIIAMQIENEFGGFGRPDAEYLKKLRKMYHELGADDVLLFTSDGTWNDCLENGSIDGVLMTANFGSHSDEAFEKLELLRPGEPKCCMEFWNGWFDQWGVVHHTREPQSVVDELKRIIEQGGHFSIYMFSGGTNFGFMNGSNCNPHFEPCITSYDYGAALTEYGASTRQYELIKQMLTGDGETSDDTGTRAYPAVTEFIASGLFDNKDVLGRAYKNSPVRSMEECSQSYGYIMYEADIDGMSGEIDIGKRRDRVMLYADGRYIGVHERGTDYAPIFISGAKRLTILVENLGRVNYGQRIFDRKGLLSNVKIGGQEIEVYDIHCFEMDKIPPLSEGVSYPQPIIYRAEFIIDEPCDTFLRPSGFTHGFAVINGFNLGRYRSIGPQQTLYVPAGVLTKGRNELVILDLYPAEKPLAEFLDRPVLDELKNAD